MGKQPNGTKMEKETKELGKSLIDLNIILNTKLEGFDFENKHKNIAVDAEFKILHLLAHYGRLTPSELVSKLCIAKSNLSNQCKAMQKEGLIKQFGDKEDKRIVCYGICAKGKAKYDEVLTQIVYNFNETIKNDKEIIETVIKLSELFNK